MNINGDYLEGGGQIVRTALALSVLTGKPVNITNIRKKRPRPGLKNQHLHAVYALQKLCDADVKGAELGSLRLEFVPKVLKYRNLNIDIGTAGSVTLLCQALLPVLIFTDRVVKVRIIGGTDTKFSMPVDYFVSVFLPQLRKFAGTECLIVRRGYYPKGGGEIILTIKPKSRAGTFDLVDRGNLVMIKGVSHASKQLINSSVSERQARTAKLILGRYNVPVKIATQYAEALSIGTGITLWAVFSKTEDMDLENPVILGSDALGDKGVPSEKIGQKAALDLIQQLESGGCTDSHLTDQVLPYMAFFGGKVLAGDVTDHAKTNIYTINKFLKPKFKIENNLITCSGQYPLD